MKNRSKDRPAKPAKRAPRKGASPSPKPPADSKPSVQSLVAAVRDTVAAERKRLGVTHRAGTELCGLPQHSFYKIETGRVELTVFHLFAIERGLGLPLGSLLFKAISPPSVPPIPESTGGGDGQ